jgi:hypothetical protein
VPGDAPGSTSYPQGKFPKAQQLGVKVIGMEELRKLNGE